MERPLLEEETFIRNLLGEYRVAVEGVQIVGLNPTEEEIEKAVRLAEKAEERVLFFCYDASLYPQNLKLLQLVTVRSKHCVVILLRDPYDQAHLPDRVPFVPAFGYRVPQLKAAVDSLFSKPKISTLNSEAFFIES